MAVSRICSVPGCNKSNEGRPLSRGMCSLHYQRWKRNGDPEKTIITLTPRGDARRFYEDVVIPYDGDDCLIWPYQTLDGRGMLRDGERSKLVSRLACEEIYGPPPTPEHEAAHRCGNGFGGCVNPKHLRWATHRENERDKIEHGTSQHGERNHMAKLSASDVVEIRSMADSLSQYAIARQYGVTQSTISMIVNRKRW